MFGMKFVIALHGSCPSPMFKGGELSLIEMQREHFTTLCWIFQSVILKQGKSILSDKKSLKLNI